MSRVITATMTTGRPIYTSSAIFTSTNMLHGGLSVRQGIAFGASAAVAILGPDLMLYGMGLPHVPTATGAPWDALLPGVGRPLLSFTQDTTFTWIRGHLINGRWGGSGANWNNLTPLTSTANSNHSTVEGYIDNYLTNSLSYDNAAYRTHWYGVCYLVQCSVAPFSHPTTTGNAQLYSYAPAFIRVSWRAISIAKPINTAVHAVTAWLPGAPIAPVGMFPGAFNVPVRPTVMNGVAALPLGNVAGGAVLGVAPGWFPAAQVNGFDGDIEIHQT